MSRLKWDRQPTPEAPLQRPPTPVDFRAAQRFRPRKRRAPSMAETLPARLDDVCSWLDET